MTVAERAFLAQGFADTTMQSIAAAAGASKETLYRHFKSKDDLLIEIVLARTADLRRSLDENVDRGASVPEVLTHLGRNLLKAVTTPDGVALLRIVVAETIRSPDLGLALYTAGPARTTRLLTAFLAAAKSRGAFHGDDAGLAASLFLGSVLGNEPLIGLLRPPKHPMSAKVIEAQVSEAVALFLTRYGAAPHGTAEVDCPEGR